MKQLVFLLPLFLIQSTLINSQHLESSERRWLIIITDESQHPELQKQINAIEANQTEAIERKIGVVQLAKNQVKPLFNFPENKKNIDSYWNNLPNKKDFEVVFIGLDGTVKLRKNKAIDVNYLFNLIDSMPMRRREMRQNKNE